MNRTSLLLWLFLLLFPNFISAQEVISSSGSLFKNSTHELSWTLGEPVIETFKTDQALLTQGFQQSNLTVTAIDQISAKKLKLKVYPNPVSLELQVEVEKDGASNEFNLSLFDITGKLIIQKKIEKPVETIDMQYNLQGSYLLKVFTASGKLLQTFKVLKH
jgi:hypothetical protein